MNLQGDVLGLINASGTLVARYIYNAWGELTYSSGSMAEINPLRYRGYYYDTETGFYYLQSRYYDPVTHRFINADSIASTGQGFVGTNMFTYCNSNPVLLVDARGNIPAFAVMETDAGPLPQYLRRRSEFIEYARTHNFSYYYSADSAAAAWAEENRPLSETTERASYIYNYLDFYFYTETYEGSAGNAIMSPNVIIPTFILEFRDQFVNATLVAQIHTHPAPPEGYHNDFPSYDSDITGGDRLAYELFGYAEMYIVPYKRHEGVPEVIKITDPSTWCQDYKPE